MTSKEALYSKLMKAYSNHVNRDTLITNYVNNVIKIMKEYLHIEQLKKENQELQNQNKAIMMAIESDVYNGELFKSICNILHIKNEKYEKAIEIIKIKKVDMRYFLECADVDTYNFWATKEGATALTQQEFELLKRN